MATGNAQMFEGSNASIQSCYLAYVGERHIIRMEKHTATQIVYDLMDRENILVDNARGEERQEARKNEGVPRDLESRGQRRCKDALLSSCKPPNSVAAILTLYGSRSTNQAISSAPTGLG